LLIEKFEYKKLKREEVDGKRLYATPDGSAVPSVTTILSATVPEEKKQILRDWKARVGEKQAQAITTEAAGRGTRMHKYLEDYVKTGAMAEKPNNPFSWASHAMAHQIIDHGLKNVTEFWGVEVPVYFPGIYAGTTDCVGQHTSEDAILDFKQSNKWKKEEWIEDYFLQLAAYGEAHNEIHGTKINKGVILMAVKPKQDEKTLEILEPPQYLEFVISGDKYDMWRRKWWDRVEMYYSQR